MIDSRILLQLGIIETLLHISYLYMIDNSL